MINTIKYYFVETFKSLVNNRLMSVASMGIVASCILIISATYCLASNIDYVLEQIEETVGVVAFMDRETEADEIEEIGKKISTVPHVKAVEYVSQSDAIESMKDYYGEGALEGVDDKENPFSKSYKIEIDDISSQESVVKEVEKINGVTKVRHPGSETKVLMSISYATRLGSIVVVALLSLMAIIIITNTIKLSVHARKEEIAIMKLVGATDWFIRWPFILEGIFLGILGMILPMIITFFSYQGILSYAIDNMIGFKIELKNVFEVFNVLLPFSLAFGILLGAIGSIFSIRKYLDV